jgi:hypothetical protein
MKSHIEYSWLQTFLTSRTAGTNFTKSDFFVAGLINESYLLAKKGRFVRPFRNENFDCVYGVWYDKGMVCVAFGLSNPPTILEIPRTKVDRLKGNAPEKWGNWEHIILYHDSSHIHLLW